MNSVKSEMSFPTPYSLNVGSLRRLPNGYAEIVKTLLSRPVSHHHLSRYRLIALSKEHDVRICSILNGILLKQGYGEILPFDRYFAWQDSSKKIIEFGLSMDEEEVIKSCNYEELESSIDPLVASLQKGWVQTNLFMNPGLVFRENESDFYLFTKPQTMDQEANLLRALSEKFGLKNDVKCFDEWHDEEKELGFTCGEVLYLWIRKNKLNEALGVFDFCLQLESGLSF